MDITWVSGIEDGLDLCLQVAEVVVGLRQVGGFEASEDGNRRCHRRVVPDVLPHLGWATALVTWNVIPMSNAFISHRPR
jgi:hypothetical protein